jgi:hypothetical protein
VRIAWATGEAGIGGLAPGDGVALGTAAGPIAGVGSGTVVGASRDPSPGVGAGVDGAPAGCAATPSWVADLGAHPHVGVVMSPRPSQPASIRYGIRPIERVPGWSNFRRDATCRLPARVRAPLCCRPRVSNRRRSDRFAVTLPVVIKGARGSENTLTANVSAHGIAVFSERPFPVRQYVELELRLPPEGQVVSVTAMVARTTESLEDRVGLKHPGVAFDFYLFDTKGRWAWRAFLDRLRTVGAPTVPAVRTVGAPGASPLPPPSTAPRGPVISLDGPLARGLAEGRVVPATLERMPPSPPERAPAPPPPEDEEDVAAFLVKPRDVGRMWAFYRTELGSMRVRIETPVLKPVGTSVEVVVVHPASREEWVLRGHVLVSSETGRGRGPMLEVALADLSEDTRQAFRRFITSGVPEVPGPAPHPGDELATHEVQRAMADAVEADVMASRAAREAPRAPSLSREEARPREATAQILAEFRALAEARRSEPITRDDSTTGEASEDGPPAEATRIDTSATVAAREQAARAARSAEVSARAEAVRAEAVRAEAARAEAARAEAVRAEAARAEAARVEAARAEAVRVEAVRAEAARAEAARVEAARAEAARAEAVRVEAVRVEAVRAEAARAEAARVEAARAARSAPRGDAPSRPSPDSIAREVRAQLATGRLPPLPPGASALAPRTEAARPSAPPPEPPTTTEQSPALEAPAPVRRPQARTPSGESTLTEGDVLAAEAESSLGIDEAALAPAPRSEVPSGEVSTAPRVGVARAEPAAPPRLETPQSVAVVPPPRSEPVAPRTESAPGTERVSRSAEGEATRPAGLTASLDPTVPRVAAMASPFDQAGSRSALADGGEPRPSQPARVSKALDGPRSPVTSEPHDTPASGAELGELATVTHTAAGLGPPEPPTVAPRTGAEPRPRGPSFRILTSLPDVSSLDPTVPRAPAVESTEPERTWPHVPPPSATPSEHAATVPRTGVVSSEHAATVPRTGVVSSEHAATVPRTGVVSSEHAATVPRTGVVSSEHAATVPRTGVVSSEHAATVPRTAVVTGGPLDPTVPRASAVRYDLGGLDPTLPRAAAVPPPPEPAAEVAKPRARSERTQPPPDEAPRVPTGDLVLGRAPMDPRGRPARPARGVDIAERLASAEAPLEGFEPLTPMVAPPPRLTRSTEPDPSAPIPLPPARPGSPLVEIVPAAAFLGFGAPLEPLVAPPSEARTPPPLRARDPLKPTTSDLVRTRDPLKPTTSDLVAPAAIAPRAQELPPSEIEALARELDIEPVAPLVAEALLAAPSLELAPVDPIAPEPVMDLPVAGLRPRAAPLSPVPELDPDSGDTSGVLVMPVAEVAPRDPSRAPAEPAPPAPLPRGPTRVLEPSESAPAPLPRGPTRVLEPSESALALRGPIEPHTEADPPRPLAARPRERSLPPPPPPPVQELDAEDVELLDDDDAADAGLPIDAEAEEASADSAERDDGPEPEPTVARGRMPFAAFFDEYLTARPGTSSVSALPLPASPASPPPERQPDRPRGLSARPIPPPPAPEEATFDDDETNGEHVPLLAPPVTQAQVLRPRAPDPIPLVERRRPREEGAFGGPSEPPTTADPPSARLVDDARRTDAPPPSAREPEAVRVEARPPDPSGELRAADERRTREAARYEPGDGPLRARRVEPPARRVEGAEPPARRVEGAEPSGSAAAVERPSVPAPRAMRPSRGAASEGAPQARHRAMSTAGADPALDRDIALARARVVRSPGSVTACYQLGRLLLRRDSDDSLSEATEQLQRAVELEPSHPGAHLAAAELAVRQGRFDTAAEHLQRARRLGYRIDERLERLVAEGRRGT